MLTRALLINSGGKKKLVWACADTLVWVQIAPSPSNNKHPERFKIEEMLSSRIKLKGFVSALVGGIVFIVRSQERIAVMTSFIFRVLIQELNNMNHSIILAPHHLLNNCEKSMV
ncbi:MAG: hypothetical protein ISS70_24580 [Phycisphaerae bacterium]|nr:hypothetical protein [Phycisphaerae bacterium]